MTNKMLLAGLSLGGVVIVAFGAVPVAPGGGPAAAPVPGPIAVPGAPARAPATEPAMAKPATTKDLGGTDRFLSFILTDKPVYRVNEKVYVRDILLNAATHQPLGDNQNATAMIQILGPRGNVVASGGVQAQNSIAAFDWTVPDGIAGGEYTLKVTYPLQGYAPAQRKFDIRVYRAPRLRSQITFVRDGYGAGDKVTATLHTERAEGGMPAGAKVTVTARVDNEQVYTGPGAVDAEGNCTAAFTLPKKMEEGEGTLSFAIEDGGTVETAAKTIPILLQTVDLNIYPEGGDAVAGLGTRFYFEARTPAKKPADIAGTIVDSEGKEVAQVRTEHEGRGRFELTPLKGETYTLNLTEPAGISKTWMLPAAKDAGVVLMSEANIIAKNMPVKFKILGTDAGDYKVTLRRREADVVDPIPITLSLQNQSGTRSEEVVFKPKPEVDGVLIATVWNAKGEPLAERLIYRQPVHTINVKVTPSQTTYTPGGRANLDIVATDDTGEPVNGAMVGLTVTDDSVLEMIEKREQAPRLPVMVFLEPEVKELADAQVYLDAKNPKAALATDLLLGTQGWRRFATYDAADFLSKNGDDAARVLALVKPVPAQRFAGGGGFGGAGGAQLRLQAAANAMPRAAVLEPMAVVDEAVNGPAAVDELKAVRERMPDAALQPVAPPGIAAAPMMPARGAGAPGLGGGLGGGGGGRGGGAGAFGGGGRGPARPGSFVIVREYAHELRPDWKPTDRSDFAETLYWNPAIKTDEHGHATASFALSDSVTTYRILADSFDKAGAMGTATNTVESVQAFFFEPKMPLEVTAGDEIQLPIAAVNNTNEELKNFALTLAAPPSIKVTAPSQAASDLAAGMRVREIYTLSASTPGDLDLSIAGAAGAFSDKVTRKLSVKPKGFPTQIAYGGLLDKNEATQKEVTIPNSVVPDSMQTFVTVYPSPVANLSEAVAALLREPCGCFEQTSSSNYPVAMAQQYFLRHRGGIAGGSGAGGAGGTPLVMDDNQTIAKGADLLAKGYQRLIGFECKDKGYEWFGGAAPGHEALTAYGLMEFHDMKEAGLAAVDDAMVSRTRTWLISRKDGKGGFERNAKALDSFGGAPEVTTNAYIVWALQQTGQTGIDAELHATLNAAKNSDDSYVIALAANISEAAKDMETARMLMDKLAKKQTKEGEVDGAQSSITRSGGQALAIEATSLATLAWLQDAKFAANAQSAMNFLAESCKSGRFGSTQSTILALRAITAYDTANAKPKAPGEVTLIVDDKPLGEPVTFGAETKTPLKFPDFTAMLAPGKHTLALRMKDGSQMPFSFSVNYNSITPPTDKECKLELGTWLKDAQLPEGGMTEARVLVTNTTEKDAASPIAIIGIPGGLEVRHDQLKELVKEGKIDAYEVNGREVVLYWRQLKAKAKADLSISLTAGVPGTYSAPASRVYEYYTDEYKQWAEGTTVKITPK